MASRSLTGAETVVIRLSQIPEKTRLTFARRLIRVEGLIGVPALDLLMAAHFPRLDPEIEVTVAQARSKGVRL